MTARAVVTVEEFGQVVRYVPPVVRRLIRSRQIVARGRPYRIPVSEFKKYGITYEQAMAVLDGKPCS